MRKDRFVGEDANEFLRRQSEADDLREGTVDVTIVEVMRSEIERGYRGLRRGTRFVPTPFSQMPLNPYDEGIGEVK